MAIFVKTEKPEKLVSDIKAGISSKKSPFWEVDSDGDFVCLISPWAKRAWIRPIYETNRVVFAMLGRRTTNVTVAEYAIYHSRFLELLLLYVDKQCYNIEVSALSTQYDSIFS